MTSKRYCRSTNDARLRYSFNRPECNFLNDCQITKIGKLALLFPQQFTRNRKKGENYVFRSQTRMFYRMFNSQFNVNMTQHKIIFKYIKYLFTTSNTIANIYSK